MTEIEFQYKGSIFTIQANDDRKMKEICDKFINKSLANKNNINYLYSGTTLIPDYTLSQTINNIDKKRKKMTVIVIDNSPETKEHNFIKSANFICPKCQESALYELKNHKIKIYNCKNGHIMENLLLSELDKTQMIDETEIICHECKKINKSITYNKEMYFCCLCLKNLCPLCRTKHEKNHKIINYEEKYYICDKHGKEYNSYCEECKQDICILCENAHEKHKIISYSKIIPKDDLTFIQMMIHLTLNSFKTKMNMIIDRLYNVMTNFELYFNTIERNLSNYNINNINYNILQHINNIAKDFQDNSTNEIIKDIQNIFKDNSFKEVIPEILNIYNEINKNEIELVYNNLNNEKEINILNDYFVENNKNLCKIIYENKEFDLSSNFKIDNNSNTLKIKLKGINNVTDLSDMFEYCSDLSEQSDFSNWDTRYVILMPSLFSGCKFEKLPDISQFDTSNVVDMSYMFRYCKNLKSLPDISNWNTSKVTYMDHMFGNCSSLKSLPDISKWDLTNVKKGKETKCIFDNCDESLNIPDKFLEFK